MFSDRSNLSRRRFLSNFAFASTAIATGVGSWVVRPTGRMQLRTRSRSASRRFDRSDRLRRQCRRECRKDGDQGNQRRRQVAGRPLELFIEDTASNESVAVGNVRKLIQRDKVDLVLGGITSSMRNAIKDVIVARARRSTFIRSCTRARECTPNLFCTGPTPAQQCDEFIPG
jgi:branched-chain amino acid transport system substrate-binding protein